jgi:hypothetical protein
MPAMSEASWHHAPVAKMGIVACYGDFGCNHIRFSGNRQFLPASCSQLSIGGQAVIFSSVGKFRNFRLARIAFVVSSILLLPMSLNVLSPVPASASTCGVGCHYAMTVGKQPFSVTLVKVIDPAHVAYVSAGKGEVWVGLEFKILNKSSGMLDVGMEYGSSMTDAKGNSLQQSFEDIKGCPRINDGNIAPHASTTGCLLFKASSKIALGKFYFGNSNPAVWKI